MHIIASSPQQFGTVGFDAEVICLVAYVYFVHTSCRARTQMTAVADGVQVVATLDRDLVGYPTRTMPSTSQPKNGENHVCAVSIFSFA